MMLISPNRGGKGGLMANSDNLMVLMSGGGSEIAS
jgi:hypothetical protein